MFAALPKPNVLLDIVFTEMSNVNVTLGFCPVLYKQAAKTNAVIIVNYLVICHLLEALLVASITINISDQEFEKMQQLAQELGISLEGFLRIRINEWLNHPQADFTSAASYVLQKNADLYKRLA
jgi:antitoxin FitA